MVKLRYIKAHGPYKPGDVQLTSSSTTVHYLTQVYKVAIVDEGKPDPFIPVQAAEKAFLRPQRDKMARGSLGKGGRG